MTKNLTDEDRRAIDILLSRDERGNGHGAGSYVSTVQGALHERVERVERLLHLLDHVPAIEPPPDLAASTLRRLDEVMASGSTALTPVALPNGAQRPMV